MSNEIVAKINARELTVREIRDVMKAADAGNLQLGMIDLLFPDGMPGAVVQSRGGREDSQPFVRGPSSQDASDNQSRPAGLDLCLCRAVIRIGDAGIIDWPLSLFMSLLDELGRKK